MILHIGRVILILLEVLILFNLLIVVRARSPWRDGAGYIEVRFLVQQTAWKKTINSAPILFGPLLWRICCAPQLRRWTYRGGGWDCCRSFLCLDKLSYNGRPIFSLLLALLPALCGWSAIQ
jgi:hypothetical protein